MQRTGFRVVSLAKDYLFGIAAAGVVQYLAADVALTGSLVRQFAADAEQGVGYDFECLALLNVTGAGIVTTNVGITGGSPVMRQVQIAQTTATVSEQRSVVGTGAQSIASSSLSTGTRSILVRGSALKTTASGILFIDFSTGGPVTLLAGSTYRAFRTN